MNRSQNRPFRQTIAVREMIYASSVGILAQSLYWTRMSQRGLEWTRAPGTSQSTVQWTPEGSRAQSDDSARSSPQRAIFNSLRRPKQQRRWSSHTRAGRPMRTGRRSHLHCQDGVAVERRGAQTEQREGDVCDVAPSQKPKAFGRWCITLYCSLSLRPFDEHGLVASVFGM